jgi:hypothetical protein
MPKLSSLGAALALIALFAASPVRAAEFEVSATLTVQLGTLGGPALTGTGIGTSDGQFLGASIPAGLITLSTTAIVPITPPAIGLSLITVPIDPPVLNAAGTFVPGGGDGGGLGGLMGNSAVSNLFFTNGNPAGSVALDPLGGGGTVMALVAALPVTVVGAAWTDLQLNATTPTKTIMVMEAPTGIPSTVTGVAFDKRTAGGAGTVQLVSPVIAKIFAGNLGNLPVIGVLALQFVPEPGTTLLFGSAIVGLLAVARSRGRSRS